MKVLPMQSVLTAAGVHAPAAAFGEIAFAISPQRGIRQNSLPLQSVLTAAGVQHRLPHSVKSHSRFHLSEVFVRTACRCSLF